MKRYGVTIREQSGLRALLGPAQGRFMHETRESADAWLADLLRENTPERLASIYGAQALDTFRVDPFECWEHGDPKGIYVDDDAAIDEHAERDLR